VDGEVTLPDVDDALLLAFAPPRPRGRPANAPGSDRRDDAAYHSMVCAAEAYALRYREDPAEYRRWGEAAPAPVRALFLAIRENTPASRVQDETHPTPYRHDGTLPRLEDLSADLRALLQASWPVWGNG
jgi:hypothetical protein